ncbi:MAG: hypothetical protein QNK36_01330 [Colwellia sp.]|nr:hypothetical protein [Colwellia sp.]
MYKIISYVIIANLVAFHVQASASDKDKQLNELKNLVLELSQQVNHLTKRLNNIENDKRVNSPQNIIQLKEITTSDIHNTPVILSDEKTTITYENNVSHVLANPWWKNIELWGFGAVGAYQTGSDGTHSNFGFNIKEATLFMEASVWQDLDMFIELQTNRLGDDSSKYVRTGEVYIHGRNIEIGDGSIGVKLGRIDIPFGEEYLWQDAIDNPLITNSASYPYGWDEGVLVYGDSTIFSFEDNVHWIFSITDGTDKRSDEDHSDKAFNLKFYGDFNEDHYLSLSLMHNGKAQKSALEFGGSHFEPIGKGDADALTKSDSTFINATLAEINTKHQFHLDDFSGYLALTYGRAEQEDDISQHSRTIEWLTIEPYIQLSPNWYSLLRYSEIGTYDNHNGFHFDGKIFAGGNGDYGYDVKRFQRLGLGIGWQPNPRVRAKFEIGKDWFERIKNTNKESQDKRNFLGVEVAVGF